MDAVSNGDTQLDVVTLFRSYSGRESNISGIIESTFSVENNSFGALVVHELKPGGASIPVTEENKREYVKLYVNYRFMRGIEQQFLALQKGNEIYYFLPVHLYSFFSAYLYQVSVS